MQPMALIAIAECLVQPVRPQATGRRIVRCVCGPRHVLFTGGRSMVKTIPAYATRPQVGIPQLRHAKRLLAYPWVVDGIVGRSGWQ